MNTTDHTTVLPVPGPARGRLMTKEYVRAVGRMADIWRWPLDHPGVLPAVFDGATMLTADASRDEVGLDVAGGATTSSLDTEPIQMPAEDFGDRFWIFPLYEQRSDVFSPLGNLANVSDRHSRR